MIVKSCVYAKNGERVFLIPANFILCKFKQLRAEYDEKNYILWELPRNASHKIQPNDICYFYYTHLPSATGKYQSRILMRGIVKDVFVKENKVKKGDIDFTDDKSLVDAFSVSSLQPISLRNSRKFSSSELETTYGLSIPQSIQMLQGKENVPENGLIHDPNPETQYWKAVRLYRDIEADVCAKEHTTSKEEKGITLNGLQELINYFEIPCAFENMLHPRANGTQQKDPLTFVRRSNGLRYYEKHHFVQQHSAKKIQNVGFTHLVEHENNLINLCPYCHRKIHHATPDVVSEMVEELYRQTKPFLDEHNLSEYIDGEDPLTWLKQMYKANNERADTQRQDPHSLPKDVVD